MRTPASQPILTRIIDRLHLSVYTDREELGAAAGAEIASAVRTMLASQSRVRMVFAAAPSQNESLATLADAPGIDWSRVSAFHMDEYIGLPHDAPQRFGHYLQTHLFDLVKPGQVNLIDGAAAAELECLRYSQLVQNAAIDIVCLGIGENGHLAFNDPPVADFEDPKSIKVVALDETCRQQQVNDGCFRSIEAVPTHALTLTIPTLLSGKHLFCMVPGSTKRKAIARSLNDPIHPKCPATILRRHRDCRLYADRDSFGEEL